ncbi:MAG: alpha/beta hydrolase [Actinobacteria bacterium]|nr:alpha/beta hydrolase [Actinomycetota bacterium]
MSPVESLTLSSTDGVELEAELAHPTGDPTVGVVLCHPHPQYGGTMRSIVTGALFEALPSVGALTLRFNFRGVERSTGSHDGGPGERDDARTALRVLTDALRSSIPVFIAGWSFGADVALSIVDPAIHAWVAIAPPLRLVADLDAIGNDPRPKLLVLGEHDDICPSEQARIVTAGWTATTSEVIAGASHFFVGRTDRVVNAVTAFVARPRT